MKMLQLITTLALIEKTRDCGRFTPYVWVPFVVISVIFMNGFPASAKELTIGFIPMTTKNEHFVIMSNAAAREAEKNGVRLIVKSGSGRRSGREQEMIIQQMIIIRVDAICIVPSSTGVVRELKKVQQAGIPIVNVDQKIDPVVLQKFDMDFIPYVGTNNYDNAWSAGDFALDSLDIKGRNVGILIGRHPHSNAVDRWKGFKKAVDGKVQIVFERPANWEKNMAYNTVKRMLENQTDVDFIFASNDNMALGALDAIAETGNKGIQVMGFDGIGPALDAIEQGRMAATMAQMPAEMGIQSVQMVLSILQGKPAPLITYTPTKIIDASNVVLFKQYLNQYR